MEDNFYTDIGQNISSDFEYDLYLDANSSLSVEQSLDMIMSGILKKD